jgi:hypothetical protein
MTAHRTGPRVLPLFFISRHFCGALLARFCTDGAAAEGGGANDACSRGMPRHTLFLAIKERITPFIYDAFVAHEHPPRDRSSSRRAAPDGLTCGRERLQRSPAPGPP